MQNLNLELSACLGSQKVEEILTLNNKLSEWNEKAVYDRTGCLSSCTKDEYQREVVIDLAEGSSDGNYRCVRIITNKNLQY